MKSVETVKAPAAGSSIEQVVKTEVFLKNMTDFAAMNEV